MKYKYGCSKVRPLWIRLIFQLHPTEPASYTDSYTTVLAEEFPNSERTVAAAVGIVGFIICLL